ncbi:MAG TPA: glycosyltransferase [Bryobacteraceae bacterium]|nr:glycosyltransferase [Bryobacteraceae bacterium]
MRVLLLQRLLYAPAYGGANKSNQFLLKELVKKGHTCAAVAPRSASWGSVAEHNDSWAEAARRGWEVLSRSSTRLTYISSGVTVHAIAPDPNELQACIRGFQPDCAIVSSEDPGQILLRAALHSRAPVIYLAHTTLALPFGPDCAVPSENGTELLERAAAIVCDSKYIYEYCVRWGKGNPIHLPFQIYAPGPFPAHGTREEGLVFMVNPCDVKGLPIFLELARRFPNQRFGAVPTWGTTSADLQKMNAIPNVTLQPPSENIDAVFERTYVLLVPSLWAEAKGRIAIEAMARGIPVLASDSGGLPEAKLGVDYVLPVCKIQHYSRQWDERFLPMAEIPAQDVGPWEAALARLLEDREHYEELSRESRAAASAEIEQSTIDAFDRLIAGICAEGRAPLASRRTSR